MWLCQLFWPVVFLTKTCDGKGVPYGCKSETLEAIGLLLPFLCIPKHICGHSILFKIDNMSVVTQFYKKRNGFKQNNFYNSTLHILSLVKFLASKLNVVVHVQYIPRISNKWSTLVDHLSRKSTTNSFDLFLIQNAECILYNGVFFEWLNNPKHVYDLPSKLLDEIKSTL